MIILKIGEIIKNLRIQCRYTQEELAEAIGTTKQTIHKYETGIISNIPASKIKAIADKLNTTPAYLMGWSEHKSENNKKSDISEFDKKLIKEYHNHPEHQASINALLGINKYVDEYTNNTGSDLATELSGALQKPTNTKLNSK